MLDFSEAKRRRVTFSPYRDSIPLTLFRLLDVSEMLDYYAPKDSPKVKCKRCLEYQIYKLGTHYEER